MKICILGQGTGGNAVLWFDLFNRHLAEFPKVKGLTYVCRTPCTLKADFPTVRPYGSGRMPRLLYRFFAPWVARVGFRRSLDRLKRQQSFDILHLQGNYSPSLNLMMMDALSCPTVLNIYGSDFYRKYLLDEFSRHERESFEKVIHRADHITCNWYNTHREFVKAFPEAEAKSSFFPWGVDEKWMDPAQPLRGWPDAEKVFLSARGLYDYNNVDVVVEAFCRAFADRPDWKLFIVNGYGNHAHTVEHVGKIIQNYNAQEQVIMRVGSWILEEELMALYERADYNFCFGSSDQLTVSIFYGLLKRAVNLLSPLPNYFYLYEQGYRSLQIVSGIGVEDLERHLRDNLITDTDAIRQDAERAASEFKMTTTFRTYVEIYKRLMQKPPLKVQK